MSGEIGSGIISLHSDRPAGIGKITAAEIEIAIGIDHPLAAIVQDDRQRTVGHTRLEGSRHQLSVDAIGGNLQLRANPLDANIAADGHEIRKCQAAAEREGAIGLIGDHFHEIVQHGCGIQCHILKTTRNVGHFQYII